jgi:hypothetical protein
MDMSRSKQIWLLVSGIEPLVEQAWHVVDLSRTCVSHQCHGVRFAMSHYRQVVSALRMLISAFELQKQFK